MIDLDAVKSRLNIRVVLEYLGWRIRFRTRADCALCQGRHRRRATVSFNHRNWHCHRCGAGGSVIDLLMAAHGISFHHAVLRLAQMAGISEDPGTRRELIQERKRRERLAYERREREAEQRRARLATRDWLHCAERLYRETNDRLSELLREKPEKSDAEQEQCWEILSRLIDEIRDAETEYYELAEL